MLKNVLCVASLCLLVFFNPACKKDCKARSVDSEKGTIEGYATANGITATMDPTGVYYEIIEQGSGQSPTDNSSIVITYTGKMLNGQIFDQQLTPNNTRENGPWPLTNLIQGWQKGLKLIQEGGHIKLIVPSSMAYGCEPFHSIPGNSILYFDIRLIDVQ